MTTSDDRRRDQFQIVSSTQADALAVIRDAREHGLDIFVVGDYNEPADAERAIVGGLGFPPLIDMAAQGPGTIDGFFGARVLDLVPGEPQLPLVAVLGHELDHDHVSLRIETVPHCPAVAQMTAGLLCPTAGVADCLLLAALGRGQEKK